MKSYKVIWIAALLSVSNLALAEVYKCNVNGKVTYQASPCQDADEGQVPLKIRPADPVKEMAARREYEERQRFYLENKLKRAQIDAERARANSYNAMAEATRANAEARLMESESRQRYYGRPRLADRHHLTDGYRSSSSRFSTFHSYHPSLRNR